MLKKSLVSILILIAYLSSCLIIYNTETSKEEMKIKTSNIDNSKNTANYINNNKNKDIIGTLTIKKINLSNNIYDIESSHNNVNENVTILNDTKNLIVLAAHSGRGYVAYFDDLDKLVLNDTINLTYKNENLIYKVINIEEQIKDGTIEINKTDTKRLILTTCSKKDKNKQLVITSQLI